VVVRRHKTHGQWLQVLLALVVLVLLYVIRPPLPAAPWAQPAPPTAAPVQGTLIAGPWSAAPLEAR
jgi:hypothetical protein